MIKITNISTNKGLEYGKGEQMYHLFVNGVNKMKNINITFKHNYEDGLVECLRKAANAVDDKKELT